MTAVLRAVVRWLGETLVGVYYPERVCVGEPLPPRDAPVIFALNHPNGLLDPLLLRVVARRPVRFLAKSTFYGNPLGKLAMESFGSLPVYRTQDAPGAAPGSAAASSERAAGNERTFARCRDLLRAGEAIALFPEGTSHSDPRLRPLKTGAARIALSAEDEAARADRPLGLRVVPVGLRYEQKATFRSAVVLVVGRPIEMASRIEDYRRDERAAVDALTGDIRAALDDVVLQAETRDLVEGIVAVASWTAEGADAASDPAARHQRAQQIHAAYRTLLARNPERLEAIVHAVRDYARILRRLGVRDPWAIEIETVRPGRALGAIARLALLAPAAAAGALLGWLPYRLAGHVASQLAEEEDVLGTVKFFTGAAFLAAGWSIETIAAGIAAGAWAAAAVALAGPLGGYAALRFSEHVAAMRESARHLWLRAARFRHVRRLGDRRRALAAEVSRALVEHDHEVD